MSSLIESHSVSRELARIGIERAVDESLVLGCRTCIAIVDNAGHLVSYDRMDGAPFQSGQHARDKAVSVAGNHMATHEMWEMVAGDPWLMTGVGKVQGLVVLGGGVPIRHDGELIGAVGVSGTCGMSEDRAIAESAVGAILAALGGKRADPTPGRR
jgi:uncharacterized protein GlcG (DUF336 family)